MPSVADQLILSKTLNGKIALNVSATPLPVKQVRSVNINESMANTRNEVFEIFSVVEICLKSLPAVRIIPIPGKNLEFD